MKYLCEKDSALCSDHLTSPYALGCSSWGTSSESDVQQSSMSKSLTLKMSVLPQQCHKTKPPSFQFQDQDSSSTQLTGQSYPEISSPQSGICIEILSISLILNFSACQLVFVASFCYKCIYLFCGKAAATLCI